MTPSELYLPAVKYAFEAEMLTHLLQHRRSPDPDALRMGVHSQLRLAGIDMGGLVLNTPRVDPELRGDLIEALIAIEPSPFSGEIDLSDVRLVLGEVGDVWPDTILSIQPLKQLDPVSVSSYVTPTPQRRHGHGNQQRREGSPLSRASERQAEGRE
ncbi:hypothetical protein PZ895_00450 [Mesorhizobium sp. YIM 152430]|uniref:hypothetical protein n=1 Tax=Mesorhizobium sp. YIM 152430 TaxID=3031761 RepID=UPI0023DC4A5E|nr:hypothetical protein [Mesorhizobium sp. YIM 152430]MDF1598246.1 hypothetical protein [Mesorhizobium sp. YIM 152430]